MTLIADAKGRVNLRRFLKPGQAVQVETEGDAVRLHPLAHPAKAAPPVAQRGRYCQPADFRGIDLDEPAFPPLS